MKATTPPAAAAGPDQGELPDLAAMRRIVTILLDPDAVPEVLPPSGSEIDTLTRTVRGQLELLIPEVEAAARKLGKESIPRYCALACVSDARGRLQAEPSRRYGGAAGHARRLARALNALCDHYEQMSGEQCRRAGC
ncbi:DUF6415 family natural product biosynthesis protein [Streptomyces olivochromogenes]|uniref:DUF6415 family natural product biosynthesis protein n=1 Tax=Streptomyces olivochromogenes TaxID=1963 RepID=UPI001F1B6419|nr:DUF6415 family natural product biosynthesis protein [Streptomyces olivochromogenes]MCF3134641.1 hypothetical protein [Streptomyces olivochromogenes]